MNRCSEAACSRGRAEDACRWHRAACFHRQGGTWTRHTPCDGAVRERNAGQSRADVPSAGGLGNGARPPGTRTSRPPAIERPRRDREPRALREGGGSGRRPRLPPGDGAALVVFECGPLVAWTVIACSRQQCPRKAGLAAPPLGFGRDGACTAIDHELPSPRGPRREARPAPATAAVGGDREEDEELASRLCGCVRADVGRGKGKRRARRGPGGRLRY